MAAVIELACAVLSLDLCTFIFGFASVYLSQMTLYRGQEEPWCQDFYFRPVESSNIGLYCACSHANPPFLFLGLTD